MNAGLDVVIPVRNVDRYLGEALASVLEDSLECSIVVVDAGSDVPIVMPGGFADRPDVRLIRSETPLTAGGARNAGVAAGSAAWISFLDADDVWTPGSRSALIAAAVEADAQLAVGTLESFYADEASTRLALAEPGKKALLAGGIVVRRATWDAVGPFDDELRSGEFIEWYGRAVTGGARTAEIPALVMRRRIHLESTTAGQLHDRDDYLKVVRRWMSRNDS